jgi:hypothetical protein
LTPELLRNIYLPQTQFLASRRKVSRNIGLELGTLHAAPFDRDQFGVHEAAHRRLKQFQFVRQFEVHLGSLERD